MSVTANAQRQPTGLPPVSNGAASLSWAQAYTPRGEVAAVQRYKDAAGTQVAGATSYTYDSVAGLLKTITHYGGGTLALPYSGTVLASYVYGYDPANLFRVNHNIRPAP